MASDAFFGKTVLVLSFSLFIYYVFWVIVLPFILVGEDNWIHSVFPTANLSLIIPAIAGIFFFGGLSVYTLVNIKNGFHFILTARR